MLVTTVTEACPSTQIEKINYQVVHCYTGHLRICIPILAYDSEYASILKYLIESLDFVTSVRINPAASSVIVEYNYEASPDAIATLESQVFTAIQQAARADIPLLPTSVEQKPSSHEINYWERLGLPALGLVLGLSAMAGLPIPGVAIGAVIFASAVPVFQRALDAIQQERQLTIDFLDGLAISLHTLRGNYFAPSFMVGLIESGEVIRDTTRLRHPKSGSRTALL